jgi:DNA-binding Lrp family transcriptional regulator
LTELEIILDILVRGLTMQNEILRLLSNNAKLTAKEIADRLDMSETEVKNIVAELENNNTIKAYRAIIDESILPESSVKAIIEVKVRPEREGGFDGIAKRLSKFSEVSSLYLMSGGFDLQLVVNGETLHDVANFVSSKLATIDGVISTTTHFLLKKYKESGKILHEEEEYERLKVTP